MKTRDGRSFVKPVSKTTRYPYQDAVFEETRDMIEAALFLEMGTGKTKIILDTLCWLWSRKKLTGALIVCPATLMPVWKREFEKHYGENWDRAEVYLYKNAKTKDNEEIQKRFLLRQKGYCPILIMSIESLSRKGKGLRFVERFLMSDYKMMVIDESTTIKNPKAKRSRAVRRLGGLARYRRILTGTPLTNSPLDLFSQMSFLHTKIFGTSFTAFRSRYAHLKDMYAPSGKTFQVVTGFKNLPELKKRIQPYSVWLRKEECLGLPEKVFQTFQVELSPRQKQAYEEMETMCLAELGDEEFVSATIVLTKLLRLQQIADGFLPRTEENGEEKIHWFEPIPRLEVLLSIMEWAEGSGGVVIWSRFRSVVSRIAQELQTVYPPTEIATLTGGISPEEKASHVEAFQRGDLRVLVGTPATGKFGLTLTAAQTMVFYDNDFSLETRLQSIDRAHRIGQKHNVTYIDLVAEGTIDEKVHEILTNKENVSDVVTRDGWKAIWKGGEQT